MSHIPASKMPHAKPHDGHAEHDGHAAASASPDASATPKSAKTADQSSPAPGSKTGRLGAAASLPFIAIAAVGAVAIGGIVAAVALRHPEPPHKPGKGEGKGKGRARKDRDEA